MSRNYYPTVNELRWNKEEREAKRRRRPLYGSNKEFKYRVGDTVTFRFGSSVRTGRITTVVTYTLDECYNIETPARQWFQKILQRDIVCKFS